MREQIIKLNKIDVNTIDYVNSHYANNPNIVLEINNTKGISVALLKLFNSRFKIRVIGGYTYELLKNRSYKDSFNQAETYTRNELIQIVNKMEEIEKGILPNWSQIQKTVYLYNKLKSYIIYDKDHKQKDRMNLGDKENRSLRALISRKSVCAGFALTLKEMLDRQGIENEYVIGGTKNHPGNHAWIILKINGRKFPLDLTWDAGRYRAGNFHESKEFFINLEKFLENHIPDMGNATMDYEKELSGLTSSFIDRISIPLTRDQQYNITTYTADRHDGSQFIISQMNEEIVNGVKYYQFAYISKLPSGLYSKPIILYSDTNIAQYIKRKFDTNITLTEEEKKYESAICNQLFSLANINKSISSNSCYIGALRKNNITGNYDIRKNQSGINEFAIRQKQFKRNDGSEFVLRKKNLYVMDNKLVYCYDCCEFFVDSDGKNNFRKNVIFSKQDLFRDDRIEFVDQFLSRERIDRMAKKNGGYIGEYTPRKTIIIDDNIKSLIKLNRMNWSKEDVVRCKKFKKVPHIFERSDGTKFTLARMHRQPREIYGNHLVQYQYCEKVPKKGGGYINRKKKIYGQDNLFDIMKTQNVVDTEFSRKKLSDENLLKTGRYMGKWNDTLKIFEFDMKLTKFFMNNKDIDFTSTDYSQKINRIYKKDTKTIKRSDGTSFKLRKVEPEKEVKLFGRRLYQYEYIEYIKVGPWIREKKNYKIFSEEDLLKEKRQDVIDYLLSQNRIERQVKNSGGYLGYYDENGKRNVVGKRATYILNNNVDFEKYSYVYTIDENKQQNISEKEEFVR